MQKRKRYSDLSLPLHRMLPRLWHILGNAKPYLLGSFIIEILKQGMFVLRIWIMALILKQLVDGAPLEQILWSICGVLLLSFILNHINILNEYCILYFRNNASCQVNQLLTRHLLSLSIGQHIHTAGGVKSSSVFRAETGYMNLVRGLVWDMFPNIIILLWLTIGFFTLDAFIGLIFLLIILGHIITTVLFNNWHIRSQAAPLEVAMRELHNHTHTTLDHVEDIKLHTQEKHVFRRLLKLQKNALEASKSLHIPHAIFRNSRRFFLDIPYMSMILLGVIGVQQGALDIGSFILISSWGVMGMRAIQGIGGFEHDLATHLASVEQLFTVLDTLNHLSVVKQSISTPKDTSIVCDQISFDYPTTGGLGALEGEYTDSTRKLFRNLSLTFPAKSTTAIVGHSGAGKSTLMKLLLRYFDVQQGEIRFGGVPLPQLSLKDLYSYIGLVPQDIALPNGTIREALLFALSEGTRDTDQLLKVLDKVALKQFIEDLPEGLDTQIGDRGVKLSGGERQRLAIARVLLRSPKVLLFDEATSHLDTLSEKLIQDSLAKASKNRTAIVIAHRLSTVKDADKIIVLKRAKVLDEGTHMELMERCTYYQEMVEGQLLD